MSLKVEAGHQTIMPYLTVKGAAKLIEFLEQVFAGKVAYTSHREDGSIAHTEVRIADTTVMLADVSEQWDVTTAGMYIYVPDTDAAYEKALAMGAKSIMEPADQPYKARMGGVIDPFGNTWWISTLL